VERGLLAFRAADTHLHLLVLCDRRAAGQLARRIEIALTMAGEVDGAGFAAVFHPVRDGRHLTNAFWYILRQHERHELQVDVWGEASNLPDLIGLRVTGWRSAENVAAVLPRVSTRGLLDCLGLKSLGPAGEPIHLVADATAAAVCLPDLTGRGRLMREVRVARCAAAHVVGPSIRVARLSDLLRVSQRTAHRLRRQRPNRAVTRAIRLQLGLRAQALEQVHAVSPQFAS